MVIEYLNFSRSVIAISDSESCGVELNPKLFMLHTLKKKVTLAC